MKTIDMDEKTLEKMIEFFNKIECQIKVLLKNPNKNSEYEYYAIYSGKKDLLLNDNKYSELNNFQKTNKTKILIFYEKYCISIKDLIKEFEQEGYKIIYNKDFKLQHP